MAGTSPAMTSGATEESMTAVPTNRIASHPGTLLLELIREMGLTVHRVARDSGLPATRLREIVHERRGVSAETAIALGAYFGQTPEFWINAQKVYELSKELVENGEGIRARVRPCEKERAAT